MPRRLSTASLSKYLEGGIYYDFLQHVKADKELAFEIRVKDEVMIYCQKNLILRISHKKNASDNITMLNPRYYTNRKDGLTLSTQLNEPSDLQDIHKVRQYFDDAKALCKTTNHMMNLSFSSNTKRSIALLTESILLLTWNGHQTKRLFLWNIG